MMNGLTKLFLYFAGCSGIAGVVLYASISFLMAYCIILNRLDASRERRESAVNILFGSWGDAIFASAVFCSIIAILCLIGALFAYLIG